jgi:hypothetical protein
MMRRPAAIAAALLALSCGGEMVAGDAGLDQRAQGIVGGSPDTGDDPHVFGLADAAGNVLCSGTLVASNLVLSAAHCFKNEQGQSINLSYVFVCRDATGESPSSAPQCYVTITGLAVHPDFHFVNGRPGPNDIAVVQMAQSVQLAPKPLPTAPIPADTPDCMVRILGYGTTGGTAPNSNGMRREARAQMTYVGPLAVASPNAEGLDPNTFQITGVPGTCVGDSGGPAYWPAGGASEAVVGITSWGDAPCTGFGVFTMVSGHLCWLKSIGVPGAQCPAGGDRSSIGGRVQCGTVPGGNGEFPGGGGGSGSHFVPAENQGCGGGPAGLAAALAPGILWALRKRRKC